VEIVQNDAIAADVKRQK